ncbi:MAG: hypothetical protein AAGK78_15565, partial [Planctomycetota bacterium]
LIVVPVISCAVFVFYDFTQSASGQLGEWLVLPESLLVIPPLLVVLVAFASIVGMSMSLRTKTTVRSVMVSLAIVVGLFAVLGFCGNQIVSQAQLFGVAIGAFSPLTVIMVAISPENFGGDSFDPNRGNVASARLMLTLFSFAACAGYAFAVYGMYKSMVKNFDMTIRRQQR